MRGPKPTPTSRRRLEGNPSKRPLNDREPEPPAPTDAFDRMPPEIAADVVAAGEWRRLAPLMRSARMVTEIDRASLLALCQQWSVYQDASSKVPTAGMIVKSPSGYPMPNPYIAIANKALVHCMKLWAELGLTPSSRSRVRTDGPDASNEFGEFVEDSESTSVSTH